MTAIPLALVAVSPTLTAAERREVGTAFRELDAARALPKSHARTVAVELAERGAARARAILAAAKSRR